jgi:tetratricopeptide (TPR) repeat protein
MFDITFFFKKFIELNPKEQLFISSSIASLLAFFVAFITLLRVSKIRKFIKRERDALDNLFQLKTISVFLNVTVTELEKFNSSQSSHKTKDSASFFNKLQINIGKVNDKLENLSRFFINEPCPQTYLEYGKYLKEQKMIKDAIFFYKKSYNSLVDDSSKRDYFQGLQECYLILGDKQECINIAEDAEKMGILPLMPSKKLRNPINFWVYYHFPYIIGHYPKKILYLINPAHKRSKDIFLNKP